MATLQQLHSVFANKIFFYLTDSGFKMLSFDDPMTYNLGKNRYRTYSKNGVYAAVHSKEILMSGKVIPTVEEIVGDEKDITIHKIWSPIYGIDRVQSILKDLIKIADINEYNLYARIKEDQSQIYQDAGFIVKPEFLDILLNSNRSTLIAIRKHDQVH